MPLIPAYSISKAAAWRLRDYDNDPRAASVRLHEIKLENGLGVSDNVTFDMPWQRVRIQRRLSRLAETRRTIVNLPRTCYAIVRYDGNLVAVANGNAALFVKIVKVMFSADDAFREVERHNSLRRNEATRYFVSSTHVNDG